MPGRPPDWSRTPSTWNCLPEHRALLPCHCLAPSLFNKMLNCECCKWDLMVICMLKAAYCETPYPGLLARVLMRLGLWVWVLLCRFLFVILGCGHSHWRHVLISFCGSHLVLNAVENCWMRHSIPAPTRLIILWRTQAVSRNTYCMLVQPFSSYKQSTNGVYKVGF